MRWLSARLVPAIVVLLCAACAGQPAGREYHLEGQVLAIDAPKGQVMIRCEEIPGYMAAMTMPFTVKDASVIGTTRPGDLVNGTLFVSDTASYVTKLTTVGSAPLPGAMPAGVAPILDPGADVPDAHFTDQRGQPRTIASFRGTTVVLTFIYTRCPLPDFCPLMDRHFARLQQAIGASPALRGRVHLVSITVDPAFDTPAVLRKHAAELGANPAVWTFLTGEGTDAKAFAGSLGVFVSRGQGDEGAITHNLRTAIIDPRGRLAKIYDGNKWTPDQVLHDLTTIVGDAHTTASIR